MNHRLIHNKNRNFGLDLFRAIAIILVVFVHGNFILGEYNFLDYLPILSRIDGVELFFVLSGFLIGGIFFKSFDKQKISLSLLLNFWKRRWFRTLPNYYLFLIINVLLVQFQVINGDIDKFGFEFFIFIQNFNIGYVDFFWESWSLSVEEWFYILFPIIFIFISLILRKRKIVFLLSIVILITFPLFYRISKSQEQVDLFWWGINFRKVVLCRLDSIGFGVLMAYIKFFYSNYWNKYKNPAFVIGLLGICILLLLKLEPNSFFKKTIFFTIISFSFSLLLAKFETIKKPKFKFLEKIITHISIISYSMYLINLAPTAQVIEKNFSPQNSFQNIIYYLIYWIIVLLSSTLIYRYYEKPLMDLRDKT